MSFRTVIILFYVGNEGMSIVENSYKPGVPITKSLRGRFLKFMEGDSETDKLQDEVT